MTMRDQIMQLVESSKSGLTYSKLTAVDGFQGTCLLTHAKFPMVHYWEGLNESAARAIIELTSEGLLRHEPTDTLAYVAHGPTLDLPIFTVEKIMRASELEQPHWMPVLLVKAV